MSSVPISTTERLQLNKLLDESNCENNTEHIRKVKHSELIRDDIRRIQTLKKEQGGGGGDDFENLCKEKCSFLYNNYMDIFNRVLKNEVDLGIMTRFLTVLKLIEDGKVDQHEGSVVVGKILKELYLDSAVKRADQLDQKHSASSGDEVISKNEGKSISYARYKSMQ
uniref:Uncharacterized protein n=1 Tax=viral metagenome TaxID=1070528 RepID=A0A6C0I351_9ZZZZ